MFPIHSDVPTQRLPFATCGLIAVNVAIFLWTLSLGPHQLEWVFHNLAFTPGRFFEHISDGDGGASTYLPLLTNTFLHGGWLHLIFNMWTLWLFGPAVEDRFGHSRFVAFYLVCGIIASATHALFGPGSLLPVLGASGAIAAVLGAYTVMFPFSRIIVLIPIIIIPLFIPVPAMLFTGFWFTTQLFSATFAWLIPDGAGGIAWWAHVGGFLAGIVMTPFARRKPIHGHDDTRSVPYGSGR